MTGLDRLLGGPIRRLPGSRLGIVGLGAVLLIGGAAVALPPPSGAPGRVAVGTGPEVSPPSTRTEAEASAIAAEIAANAKEDAANAEKAAAGSPTPAPRYDFWLELFGVRDGPVYRSLADLGERSEAVVVGFFTGDVEAGREACDEQSLAAGAPRGQACISFANLPFRIDEVLASSLPERYRTTVKLEYQVDPGRQAALAEVVPSATRVVLFIESAGSDVRSLGWDVYYPVGRVAFREVDGRVVPVGWPDDMLAGSEIGRLEGMPFEQFIKLVRRVPILGLGPEG